MLVQRLDDVVGGPQVDFVGTKRMHDIRICNRSDVIVPHSLPDHLMVHVHLLRVCQQVACFHAPLRSHINSVLLWTGLCITAIYL